MSKNDMPITPRIKRMQNAMAKWNSGVAITNDELSCCIESLGETIAMIQCIEGDGIVTRSLQQIHRSMCDMRYRRGATPN